MALRGFLIPCFALLAGAATAEPLKSCEELSLGIEDVVGVDRNASRVYFDGNVVIRMVDTIEPACCSSGIAVVTPDPEDESGGSKCVAAIQYRGLDLAKAKDKKQGKDLIITIPSMGRSADEEAKPGQVLKLKINGETYAVTEEK